jgi:hypothetical protein
LANPLGGFFPVAAWLCVAVTAFVPSSLSFASAVARRRSVEAVPRRQCAPRPAMAHYTNEITNEIESTPAIW